MEFGKTYVGSYGLNIKTFTQEKENVRIIRTKQTIRRIYGVK